MSVVALAENLFVLFVGLELASFSTYILVAFNKESKAGSESGMKYFIVGSAASGVGLYGLSFFIYGQAVYKSISLQKHGQELDKKPFHLLPWA